VLVIELLSVAGESGSPRENRREESSDDNDDGTIGRGALESLNGMLLFGLTTAFLFAMIQRVWPLKSSEGYRFYQGPDPKQ
jgi:hypothetical protein